MNDIDVGAMSELLNQADFVIDYQVPTAANNYTWYRRYKSGWVEQGIRNLRVSSSNITLAADSSIEIGNLWPMIIPTVSLASSNAELRGNANIFTADVYQVNRADGAYLSCWIHNTLSTAITIDSNHTVNISCSGYAA